MSAQAEMRMNLVASGIPADYLPVYPPHLARILPGALSLCCRSAIIYKSIDPRDTTVECVACGKGLNS